MSVAEISAFQIFGDEDKILRLDLGERRMLELPDTIFVDVEVIYALPWV
jgi:hypothetical protein